MITVSSLYPNTESSNFDMDYYCNKHIPMVQEKLGSALKGVTVEAGFKGVEPGSAPAFLSMGHLLFESFENFQTAFGPHANEMRADRANFTNIEPLVLMSNIKIGTALDN